jgi:hypothetical protein
VTIREVVRKANHHTDDRWSPLTQMQQKHPTGTVRATLTTLAHGSMKLTPAAAGN